MAECDVLLKLADLIDMLQDVPLATVSWKELDACVEAFLAAFVLAFLDIYGSTPSSMDVCTRATSCDGLASCLHAGYMSGSTRWSKLMYMTF